ncbi:hypothetical protein [Streptomyces sp. NPDC047718]|uniref:hypothetical protein n=1 Tax=Streptomyces sp. NPDC047718 TaxID=3155479 RepID=UPI0033C9ADC3
MKMRPANSSAGTGTREVDAELAARFGEALKQLYEAAGGRKAFPFRGLARMHGVSAQRLSDWCGGVDVPRKPEYVRYVLRVLIPFLEDQAKLRSPGHVRTPDGTWGKLLDAAQAVSKSRQGGPGLRVKATSQGRLLGGPSQALRDVLPSELIGREEELADLVAFATAPDGAPAYLWWQAGPWAGKTALLAWFAARCLPDGVDAAHYVIAGRLGTDRRDAFVRAVRKQLAAGADGKRHPAVDDKRPDLHPLYEVAARASRERHRRLLLIVDGLDEDADAGPDCPGIAGLLPKDPPHGMRVIVTGRQNPRVPVNLAPDHPLREPGVIRRLTDSPAAQVIRDMAMAELRSLLADRDMGQRLLGLLVSAKGGLTAADLGELIHITPYDVQNKLRSVVGRSMAPTRTDLLPLDARAEVDAEAGRQTYVLAHRELHDTAQAALGRRTLAACTEDLHTWAREYQDEGWPEDTPNYLLTGYTHLVRASGNLERLTALITNPQRQLRLVQRSGPDVALADLDLIAPPNADRPPNLSVAAAVAASRDRLLAHVRPLPDSVARTIARLGDARRARALAGASGHSADKALNLAGVSRVLRAMGHERATDAAQEAGEWARRALREASHHGYAADQAEAAAAQAALALLETGRYEDGLELLRSTRGMGATRNEAWAQAIRLLAPDRSDVAEELLDELEEQAEKLASEDPSEGYAAAAPVQLWETAASAAPDRADRLHERVLEHAREVWDGAPSLENAAVVATAASLVVQARPAEAEQLVDTACRHVQSVLLAGTDQLLPADAFHVEFGFRHTLALLSQALTAVGEPPERADFLLELAERVLPAEPEDRLGQLCDQDEDETITEAGRLADEAFRLADRGAAPDAERHLEQALALLPTAGPGASRSPAWLPDLAAALVRTGVAADAESLLELVHAPTEQTRAHAAMALAYADSSLPAEAREHAQKASRAAASATAPSGTWAYAAQALACAGEAESALDLIQQHGQPADASQRSAWRKTDRCVRIAVATELATLHPHTSGELLLPLLKRLHAARKVIRSGGLLTGLAELLPAATHLPMPDQQLLLDEVRAALTQITRSGLQKQPEDVLVHAFLRIGDGEDPSRQLDWLRRDMTNRGPEHFPTAALAVLHAALGDTETAERVAALPAGPQHRASASTAVASHLARIPVRPLVGPAPALTDSFTRTVQHLALRATLNASPDSGAATRFLHRALATAGWFHALPALSHLAPEAVAAVRDTAVVHLRATEGIQTD